MSSPMPLTASQDLFLRGFTAAVSDIKRGVNRDNLRCYALASRAIALGIAGSWGDSQDGLAPIFSDYGYRPAWNWGYYYGICEAFGREV